MAREYTSPQAGFRLIRRIFVDQGKHRDQCFQFPAGGFQGGYQYALGLAAVFGAKEDCGAAKQIAHAK
jgi:hypothetical protein